MTFVKVLNEKHPTIKFEYQISEKEINFLDTTCYIKDKNIKTKLYKKKTDISNYLHRRSAHPEKLKKTIPYGQALRLKRICSEKKHLDTNYNEMKNNFLERGYGQTEIITQIEKAEGKNRDTLLINTPKQPLTRIPLVLTLNPKSPPIMDTIKKHWHILQSDSNLRELFKEQQMIAYRRNINLGDLLNSHTL